MLPTLTSNDPLQGLLREKHISFNMRRAADSYSEFPRKVTLFNPTHLKRKNTLLRDKEDLRKVFVLNLHQTTFYFAG